MTTTIGTRHVTDLGNAISVLFLVSGAIVMIVLFVMEYAKRLRTHVDTSLEAVRIELRRELAEQDVHRARMERRIRDLESDVLELSRARASEYSRIDAAVKSLVETVAALEKERKAREKLRERRRSHLNAAG